MVSVKEEGSDNQLVIGKSLCTHTGIEQSTSKVAGAASVEKPKNFT